MTTTTTHRKTGKKTVRKSRSKTARVSARESGKESNNVGIEDVNGIELNPLNNKPYSPKYVQLAKIWSNKLVFTNRHLLYDAIKSSQVILAVANTGTGKTILIPRIALHALDYKTKVICCIPKRLPTLNAAEFVADCMDVKLGEECGYYYQGTNMTNKNNIETKLIFTTTGSLISQLTSNNPTLADYGCVIIDEAHERSVFGDELLLLLKKLCLKRPDLKVIIMSATVSLETYRNYFPSSQYKFKEVEVGVQLSYPVNELWLDKPPADWKKTAVEITMNILKKTSIGDILIFVKSSGDANQVCMQLDKALAEFRKQLVNKKSSYGKTNKTENKTGNKTKSKSKTKKMIPKEYQINPLCIKLEGSSNALDQKIATDTEYYKTMRDSHGYPYTRKIVVSTNVAESSITIDGIVFVIDSGFEYTDGYDPNARVRSLLENKIAKSAINQRRGRAGRTQPGYCFHLYTKQEQATLQDYPTPSIEKSDITTDILNLMKLPDASSVVKMRDLLDELISPPHEKFILNSLRTLYALGAITNIQDSGTITPMGLAIAKFRAIKANHARAIIAAHFYGVSRSVCDIIALSAEADGRMEMIFQEFRPDKKKKPEQNKKEERRWMDIMKSFAHPLGDYMTLLKAYRMYMKVAEKIPVNEVLPETTVEMEGTAGDLLELPGNDDAEVQDIKQPPSLRKWCRENYINANRMARARRTSRQLWVTLQQITRPLINKRESKNKLEKQNEKIEADVDSEITELDVAVTRKSVKHARTPSIVKEHNYDYDDKANDQTGGFLKRIEKQNIVDRLEPNVRRFPNQEDNIMMALSIGNFINFAIRTKDSDSVYVSCFATVKKFAKINQDSFLVSHGKGKLPKILMYDELFQSSHDTRVLKMNIVNKIPDHVFNRLKQLYGSHIKYCI